MSVVLDASALLAFLHDEPGGEKVSPALEGARVSVVNWSELLQKSLRQGVDVAGMGQEFTEVGVRFEPFTSQQAETAAWLWSHTRNHGLSLAGRACLALAMDKGLPVITADRAWARLNLGIEIRVLR
ncbi:PIN domain-containing protein [Thioalkalivibrio paradoxus]|uniref:Twitching motility protein PilT n=1 Tax=Thioalkalivibrio paradoxus ARh 1 TaxID=713585 RepID=W0DQ04_9GAMM|nr:type II toxin-antitoxin system VapC family toxin [Thioalkalivibrio paradoxus]AHE99083.1 twitching motility protein PilT [Thioalkalivibrio paradoxus ARh 1]